MRLCEEEDGFTETDLTAVRLGNERTARAHLGESARQDPSLICAARFSLLVHIEKPTIRELRWVLGLCILCTSTGSHGSRRDTSASAENRPQPLLQCCAALAFLQNYTGRYCLCWLRTQQCHVFLVLALAGRVPALGEYGGVGYAVEGHRWSSHGAWGYGEKQVNHRQDACKSLVKQDCSVRSCYQLFGCFLCGLRLKS